MAGKAGVGAVVGAVVGLVVLEVVKALVGVVTAVGVVDAEVVVIELSDVIVNATCKPMIHERRSSVETASKLSTSPALVCSEKHLSSCAELA